MGFGVHSSNGADSLDEVLGIMRGLKEGQTFIIKPHFAISNRRLENRVLDMNQERFLYTLLLVGSVLLFVAFIW